MITGAAAVGQELLPDFSGVADPDGLTRPFARWTWIRVDGDQETEIAVIQSPWDGTISPYTLTAEDLGKRIKVKVTFLDDANNQEERISALFPSTGTVTTAPVFTAGSVASLTVPENTASGTSIGTPLSATDADGDSLTYSLTGADAAAFTIDATTGQLRSSAALDYEADASYELTAVASDGVASAEIAVTVTVTDEEEPPAAPAAPTAATTAGSSTSLDVSWTAPDNVGKPPITSYDLRYRVSGAGDRTDGPQGATGTGVAIDELTANTEYNVQVRAINDEGDGA